MAGFELPILGDIPDLSSNNGVIDWETPKQFQAAIIRSTMGDTGRDPQFADNAKGIVASGIQLGIYHLFRPEDSGERQAKHFLAAANAFPYKVLAIDVEKVVDIELAWYNDNIVEVTERLYKLITSLKMTLGWLPWIYTAPWFWDSYIGTWYDDIFSQCPLWIADYNDKQVNKLPRGWKSWALWQYSSTSKFEGIDDPTVDANRLPGWQTAVAEFKLVFPVAKGAALTQRFGANPENYEKFGLPGHEGTDWAGKAGDPISAAAGGTVKLIFKDDGKHNYGNHIRLTHIVGNDEYETIYAHLSGFVAGLQEGDKVVAGQQIGMMGSTGNSTGNHLHFTVKKRGSTASGETKFPRDIVDPGQYLP